MREPQGFVKVGVLSRAEEPGSGIGTGRAATLPLSSRLSRSVARNSGSKTETYSRITTSCGPEGRRKFEPRSWFNFRVAGTSRSLISIFLVHEPVVQ